MSYVRGDKKNKSEARRILEVARSTMITAEKCFLITLDALGHLQCRLMDPFEPEEDMKVWMATNGKTRKVQELNHDSRATLAYYDHRGTGYVTLIGHARLVNDLNERHERWKEQWKPFYPEGAGGVDYLLIEFTPSRIEVTSISYEVASQPEAFRPAILVKNSTDWLYEY